MTHHTSRLCEDYMVKRESDGVLHQMTWPPQSPDNPLEMVWDELDSRGKEKQSTSARHMWELLQDCWKSIPGEAGSHEDRQKKGRARVTSAAEDKFIRVNCTSEIAAQINASEFK